MNEAQKLINEHQLVNIDNYILDYSRNSRETG